MIIAPLAIIRSNIVRTDFAARKQTGQGRVACATSGAARSVGTPEGALVLLDAAPVIYCPEGHPRHAPRFRVSLELKLPDAIQLASAIAVNADALATHDRDFSRVKGLTVLCLRVPGFAGPAR